MRAARTSPPCSTGRRASRSRIALFAHCFTCGKDVLAAKRIAEGLTVRGIAVLRFDFTGLGASEGEFANTTFSSNVADLVAAANHLRKMHRAPAILIGHSLGGAAVLAAAQQLPGGARGRDHRGAGRSRACHRPVPGAHCRRSRRRARSRSRSPGARSASARNSSTMSRNRSSQQCLANLRKALLVMHSPTDDLVGIENASAIFTAAKHPKSFVSLERRRSSARASARDAVYVADVIAAWSERYLDMVPQPDRCRSRACWSRRRATASSSSRSSPARIAISPTSRSRPAATAAGRARTNICSPALGACTSMTIRLYADLKKLPLRRVVGARSSTTRSMRRIARTARPRKARSTASTAR